MNFDLTKNKIIILIALLLVLLPYLYISFYCNPVADDFTYAFKGKTQNLFPAVFSEYLNWNGRYISNLFVLINPIVFDSFIVYKIIPIILILLTLHSFSFFFRNNNK